MQHEQCADCGDIKKMKCVNNGFIKKIFMVLLIFFGFSVCYAFGPVKNNSALDAGKTFTADNSEYTAIIKDTALQTVQEQNSYTLSILRSALKEINEEIQKEKKEKQFWIKVSIAQSLVMAGAVAVKKFGK